MKNINNTTANWTTWLLILSIAVRKNYSQNTKGYIICMLVIPCFVDGFLPKVLMLT